MGNIDRLTRLVVATIFVIANVVGWVTDISGIVLAVLAGMLISSVQQDTAHSMQRLRIKKTI